MQLIAALTTIAFASGTSAKCFNTGRSTLFSESNQIVNIRHLCRSFVGDFKPGQSKVACLEDDIRSRWDFELKFIGTGQDSRNIDVMECMGGMMSEAAGCRFGGQTAYTNWYYM
ncbi:hypothetical protein CkaCkLH20_05937 [Colletotrichum karsti]|uniref:Uncharacterized protein n=1 Tax=Colletotrichum karsti TaxID=1095194 RepID=A0A9P6I5B7_9PEZI|nr:uncharacterized protein CkaCkLH20_05937 [Colletotrichum karsti]KAF9876529.1 hypothetical protein CkaCkLH20_05937 [Colletotrichum karsti]